MFTPRMVVAPLILIALINGCGGQSRSSSMDTIPRLDSSAAQTGGTTVGRATFERPSDSSPPAPAGRASPTSVSVPAVGRQPKPEVTQLSRVVESDELVGRTVRVTGACAGYGVAGAGPPPQSRSDWVLRSDNQLIYVVGAFPPGCGPQGGDGSEVTIVGRVAEDTLPSFAGRPGQPRRYLISISN